MAFTVKDFEDLLRILDRYPRWREELRRRILLEELEQLPQAHRRLSVRMGRMEKALVALAETVNRTAKIQQRHAKVLMKLRQEVAEARAEANRRFAELAEAQRRTEEGLEMGAGERLSPASAGGAERRERSRRPALGLPTCGSDLPAGSFPPFRGPAHPGRASVDRTGGPPIRAGGDRWKAVDGMDKPALSGLVASRPRGLCLSSDG
jgi:hypothetical protein